MVTPDKLKAAVEGRIPTDAWLVNHFHMGDPLCRPLWTLAIQLFWDEVESNLTDVSRLYGYLTLDPRNRAILDTPEGRDFLNRACRYFYAFLRLYAFEFRCPLCGRKVDAVNDAWLKFKGDSNYYHAKCVESYRKIGPRSS
jgi:hypothetical protein